MPLDLSKIHPVARKAFIQSGRKFGSKDTLAQADKTLNGLAVHAAKLEDHGFGPDDVNELKSAREQLIAAGVSREDKRVGKKTTSDAYTAAMRNAQQVRLRARSVLKAAKRVLAQTGGDAGEEAARRRGLKGARRARARRRVRADGALRTRQRQSEDGRGSRRVGR